MILNVSPRGLIIFSTDCFPIIMPIHSTWAFSGKHPSSNEVMQFVWDNFLHSEDYEFLDDFRDISFFEVCDDDEWRFLPINEQHTKAVDSLVGSGIVQFPYKEYFFKYLTYINFYKDRPMQIDEGAQSVIDARDKIVALVHTLFKSTFENKSLPKAPLLEKRPIAFRKKIILCLWLVYLEKVIVPDQAQMDFIRANKYITLGPKTRILILILLPIAFVLRVMKFQRVIRKLVPASLRTRALRRSL